jgi:nucleotidyltransferase substrate binding protein (TIGR01987 family)
MSERKLQDSLANLERASKKLQDALLIPKERELVVEGTIQRFEMVVELTWKTLKRAMEYEGLHPKTPRDSLKEAFRLGWIHDEDVWLEILEQRNTTSHVYLSEELAENNYEDIQTVAPVICQVVDFLRSRYPLPH